MDNEQNPQMEQPEVAQAGPTPVQEPVAPTPPQQPTPEEGLDDGGAGPIIGSIIVILVIIAGGVYFWLERTDNSAEIEALLNEEVPAEDNVLSGLQEVETSDDIDAIEADLEGTDLDSLDDELGNIDALLEADLDNI